MKSRAKYIKEHIEVLELLLKSYEKQVKPRRQLKRVRCALVAAIEALKKQMPFKPIEQSTDEKTHYKCACGTILKTEYKDGVVTGYIFKYCKYCGQRLESEG